MTKLTDKRLAEIKAGLEGLPGGPWAALRSDPAEGVNCWWIKAQPSPIMRGFTQDIACIEGGYGPDDNREIAAHIARMDPQTVTSLIARLEAAEAERDAGAMAYSIAHRDYRAVRSQLDEALFRVKVLEEALRPFGHIYHQWMDGAADNITPANCPAATVKDLRRARAALEGGE